MEETGARVTSDLKYSIECTLEAASSFPVEASSILIHGKAVNYTCDTKLPEKLSGLQVYFSQFTVTAHEC